MGCDFTNQFAFVISHVGLRTHQAVPEDPAPGSRFNIQITQGFFAARNIDVGNFNLFFLHGKKGQPQHGDFLKQIYIPHEICLSSSSSSSPSSLSSSSSQI